MQSLYPDSLTNWTRFSFFTAFLKLLSVGIALRLHFNLAHKNGPKYLRECLPYFIVSNLCVLKSAFLRLYYVESVLNISTTVLGSILCLIFYMKIAISCNLLLNREVIFALPSKSSYNADQSLNTTRGPLSFKRSSFLLSLVLQKYHTKLQ